MTNDGIPTDGKLAAFVATSTADEVPDVVRRQAERAFVDTVGVALAGTNEPVTRRVRHVLGDQSGSGLASTDSLSVPDVGLLNGTAGHALDYDDTTWGVWHPSVTLVPAILAVGASRGIGGPEAITAYAVGFGVESHLAERLLPGHYEAGWHATSTFGTVGATAAVASLLDLDETVARNALNISASMSAGLKKNFGTMTKPLHAGFTAQSGITAASLAEGGLTAADGALGDDGGFCDLYSGTTNERRPDQTPLGEPWSLTKYGLQVKKYPCCYFTHPGITATQTLAGEYAIDPSTVEQIVVEASRGAADALLYEDPDDGLEAKFSMEYTIAAAVVEDDIGLDTFDDDRISDRQIQRIRERVDFRVDPELTYDPYETTVTIDTTDGGHYTRTQEKPPGTPDNPLTQRELRAKFEESVQHARVDVPIGKVYTLLNDLWEVEDLSTVMAHITGSTSKRG